MRGRIGRALLLVYVMALAASYLVWWTGGEEPVPPGLAAEPVPVFDRDTPTGGTTRMVYREAGPEDAPVVVLLHGSPGSSSNFEELIDALADDVRVLAPDLPGYGHSRAELPDYSMRSHAHSLAAWLAERGIEGAHLVGFSLGGGVALHVGELDPDLVASVTLLASIGVQELEWFGTYERNHTIHALQLFLWRGFRWLFPHFGAADAARGYVRGFHDSDQRPLRGILEGWEKPLLVVHGEDDFLVPVEAAREHHRIVPHSELALVEDGSHFLVWTWTEELARTVLEFVGRVEAGDVPTRADADPERVREAEQPYDPETAPPFAGFALLVVLFMLAGATLISEDLTCFTAGLLVAQGRLEFVWAVAACFAGIFVGDVGLFLLGRVLGRPALRRAPLRWMVSEAKVERARHWFESRGVLVIFLSRFTPGLRLPTYVAAGVVRTSLPVFTFWFVLAGLLWTPALVGAAAWIGREAEEYLNLFGEYALWGVLGLLFLLVLVERMMIPLFTWRGRRLLWGRIQRIWRWEFWPLWLFYLPVIGWIAWLALRHRSLTLVAAANPAIPAGGVVGESKRAILEGLGTDDPRVATFLTLAPDEDPLARREGALSFARKHGWPVVLKPDVGQRGSGVRILRSEAALRRAVDELRVVGLLQEYVPGAEFGIFHARRPSEPRGRILSITEKRIPTVTGDGEHTLEHLILADRRAVCVAKVYLETNATRLEEVLPAGEELPLVDVGTHARGAIFLDGGRLETAALRDALDDLTDDYEGFWFGRYDVRAESAEALTRGEFRVIELNGVTSECTHVYDPRHSLLEAWRTLCAQWSLAFAIARENRERDAEAGTGTVPGTLREWWRYRRAQRGHARRSRE